jgi:hypothetical protein
MCVIIRLCVCILVRVTVTGAVPLCAAHFETQDAAL